MLSKDFGTPLAINDVPSRTTIERMAIEMGVISDIQVFIIIISILSHWVVLCLNKYNLFIYRRQIFFSPLMVSQSHLIVPPKRESTLM